MAAAETSNTTAAQDRAPTNGDTEGSSPPDTLLDRFQYWTEQQPDKVRARMSGE